MESATVKGAKIWKIYIGMDGWVGIIDIESKHWIAIPMEEYRKRKDSHAVKVVFDNDVEIVKSLREQMIAISKNKSSLDVMPSSEGSEGQASGFPKAEEPRDEGS